MNRKAILALLIAVLLPLTGYWIVKYFGGDGVDMPPRYFYDTVLVTDNNGKTGTDTVWHKVKNMQFINQLGDTVTLDSLRKKSAIVIDFFFTRCPSICPRMARSMAKLQQSYINGNDTMVQFISISIDPEYDSVPQLRKFADRYSNNHDNWWFVTGNKKEIYDFALQEMKANVADPNVDTAFIHTENFFLLDKNRVIRGWYEESNKEEQEKLARDIPLLRLEKNKKRSFSEFMKELFSRS